MQKEM